MKLFEPVRLSFPDPLLAMDEGIVDVREDLGVSTLLEAYSFGIFPWPHEGFPLLWFCPPHRGVLEFSRLHISRSLRKKIRSVDWTFTADRDFEAVISACAKQKRPGQSGTWIEPRIKKAFIDFHHAGYAHSIECWSGQKLIGGLYGVYVGGSFAGESMFFKEGDASKMALLFLIQFLKSEGLSWMDCQMVTPHMDALGAEYISRYEFLNRLETQKKSAKVIDFKSLNSPRALDTSNL